MRRRGPGIAGLRRKQGVHTAAQSKGSELKEVQLEAVQSQLKVFRENLERFARKHRGDINKNPLFRARFHSMCRDIGVDPLVSKKGFWAKMLGVGDFYYDLGVQVVDVCLRTRASNGGLIEVSILVDHIQHLRGGSQKGQRITPDDVERALDTLKVLGGGFRLIRIGDTHLVQSVPCELNTDHTTVLVAASANGFVVASELMENMKWSERRVESALAMLLQEGMCWIDSQSPEPQYWFPSLVSGLGEE